MEFPIYDPKLYETLEKMGTGSYGSVYRVKEVATGNIYALKQIELEEGDTLEDALVEIKVLKGFKLYFDFFIYFFNFRM
jgi:serine/threonine protein kinase